MSESNFTRLEDAILDESFPEVDLALRRGRHIDRDDGAWFTFLLDAQVHLEEFYRRFGCELTRKPDGYFYLLPTNDKLGKRQLSVSEMLVGQTLTLLYLDPATVQQGGSVSKADVLSHLSGVVGTDTLIRMLNPKRKRYDERVAHETVRSRVSEALRRLSTLGFIDLFGDDRVRLRPALMRFAEPVRNAAAPSEALARLVAAGEVVLSEGDGEEFETDEDGENESEREAEAPAAEPAPKPEPVPMPKPEPEPLGPSFEDVELLVVPGVVTLMRDEVPSEAEPESEFDPEAEAEPEPDTVFDPYAEDDTASEDFE